MRDFRKELERHTFGGVMFFERVHPELSVQAGKAHQSKPKRDGLPLTQYEEFEITAMGENSRRICDLLISEYAISTSMYGNVPVEDVQAVIDRLHAEENLQGGAVIEGSVNIRDNDNDSLRINYKDTTIKGDFNVTGNKVSRNKEDD